MGEASITPGFNFLTWEAEIKVPAHSQLLRIKSNRITCQSLCEEPGSGYVLFLLQPSYPKGTCFIPWMHRGVGFPDPHPQCLPRFCPHLAWQVLLVDSAVLICLVYDLRCPLDSVAPNPVCSNSSLNRNVNLLVSRELCDRGLGRTGFAYYNSQL